ncbi:hypothetical protein [Burkholderia latens]|uniref:3-hydroxy-3-methylglutaryl-coenzyme A reductase n=1 Tax=Burkholderia latens TaxID=488446 RepID=A0A6H9TSX6_9BURK|nr:hypothetical protein [Burkholderia latens]KAB0643449.1 hypothetical protein F7R21_07155 [Burkholderia latens]VWB13090.1 hypothetical protein BLA24064_00439 [Burkholderia latens]
MDQSQVFRAMMPGLTSAGGARIAVAYPSFPRPLPLVRLDRRGLVFRAAGAAPLVCGLPRAATLLAADEPLCSLRLVIRDVAAAGGGQHDLTMQPSGAAGDELLWHALREREPYRRIREPLAPVDAAIAPNGAPAAADVPRPSRSAAFRLRCHSDALFFADWLEYHFDELRALSQQRGPQLQLNELQRQVADDEVGVRFVYDIDGHATRHVLNDCAREACAWIESEMRDKYAVPVAQERFGGYAAHARAGGL